jgi:hypothetical protein
MAGLSFEIKHADGRTEVLEVDSERALVGSGAHCEIRLSSDSVEFETLLVEARQGAVFAEARSSGSPPTVNGASFWQGRILPDSVIAIGLLELRVSSIELDLPASGVAEKKRTKNPRVYLLAGLLCAASFYMLTHTPQDPPGIGTPPAPQNLWSADKAVCPQRSEVRALAVADELKLSADGKRERSPFVWKDGVAAVSQYQQAANCFELGGANDRARDAEHSAESLQRSVIDAYHMNRLRLERAIATGDYQDAARQVKYLKAILDGQTGPYLSWLSTVERLVIVKLANGKVKSG